MSFARQTGPTRSAQDRDQDLEASYHFHKDHPGESLVAHVSSNREALALAYFDWAAKDQAFQMDSLDERVTSFEEDRFSRALEPVAHGMLMFAIKARASHHKRPADCLFASEEQREQIEAEALKIEDIPGEGMEARLTRIAVASGLMRPPKGSPAPIVKEMPLPLDLPLVEESTLTAGHQNDTLPLEGREPGEDDDEDGTWMEEGA